MQTAKVDFKCPDCGHNRLVMKKNEIQSKESVDGFTVADSGTPGLRYNLQTSSVYHNEGTLISFECECCNFAVKNSQALPIKNLHQLFNWLKKHGMLKG